MIPAAALAGREIRQNPDTWSAYRELVRAVVESVARIPVVLLGVCTPDELHGWPITGCVLLDCTDDERQRRLSSDARFDDIEAALVDGRGYRTLGLPVVDTTGRTPSEVAADLARFVHRMDAG